MEFKTYCISLKSDERRRVWMKSIKNRIGLEFEFFNAVEPKDISNYGNISITFIIN